MGLFGAFKNLFKGYSYRINREILETYVNEDIAFSIENSLCFVSEFYLKKNKEEKNELHITIINYDIPSDGTEMESERGLKGIAIWTNNGGYYNPEEDKKFYTVKDLIDFCLTDYDEYFYLRNDQVAPTILEPYKI